MFEVLRRVSLVCAIALTIALLLASVMPSAGQAFGGELHRRAHLVSFAVLALAWRWALPRAPASVVPLGVMAAAALHAPIEIVGHRHPHETHAAGSAPSGAIPDLTLPPGAEHLPTSH